MRYGYQPDPVTTDDLEILATKVFLLPRKDFLREFSLATNTRSPLHMFAERSVIDALGSDYEKRLRHTNIDFTMVPADIAQQYRYGTQAQWNDSGLPSRYVILSPSHAMQKAANCKPPARSAASVSAYSSLDDLYRRLGLWNI